MKHARLFFWFVIALSVLMPVAVALAQEQDPNRAEKLKWIHDNHKGCCDHNDCHPAKIEWHPYGWRIEGADNSIPHRDVIGWPFAEPYACIVNRYARCLLGSNGG